MNDRTYDGIDDVLLPLHQHLELLLPESLQQIDNETHSSMSIEQIEISMPIELDVIQEPSGELSLGSSPPAYYLETGFQTVPHHLRIIITGESALGGQYD